jgi:hypothetical protein
VGFGRDELSHPQNEWKQQLDQVQLDQLQLDQVQLDQVQLDQVQLDQVQEHPQKSINCAYT